MIIVTSDGKQVRGELIKSAIIRSDLAPVPVTFEAELRVDGKLVKDGETITAGKYKFKIIKSELIAANDAPGTTKSSYGYFKIIGFIDTCVSVGYVRDKPIIKNNTTLSGVYKASGAVIKSVERDFPVPKFACIAGNVPSFHIAQILQEEAGVVRWKNDKLEFWRIADLLTQKAVITINNNQSENVSSGFLEQHEAPSFFSLNADGGAVQGNKTKARQVLFSPFKDAQRLQNMTRYLSHRKIAAIDYNETLVAGDLVQIQDGPLLAIITVAHVFESNGKQYARLWLGN